MNTQITHALVSKMTHFIKNISTKYNIKISKLTRYLDTSYGSIARNNGLQFEKIVCDLYPNLVVIPQQKVKSIYHKLTTSKADLWKIEHEYIPISVKMSNQGTQLQIVSVDLFIYYCRYQSIEVSEMVETILKKFCGITKPNVQSRSTERYWLDEMTTDEQLSIVSFFKINRNSMYEFIYSNGLCLEDIYKPKWFILNNSYYSKTKEIKPIMISYQNLILKLTGEVKITPNGNLQLCDQIGIQRKGSGRKSAQNYLQFKDRGTKNIFKND